VPAVGGGIAGLPYMAALLFVAPVPFLAFRDVNGAYGNDRLVGMVLGRRADGAALRA
jgi:hypothetical protein